MATSPKSISIHELSGAVHKALANAKVKIPPEDGPWLYIKPGVICGLVYVGPIVEANAIASSIAKELSASVGTTLSPVVQEGGAGELATAALRPGHIIMGYRPDVQVRF